MGDPTELVLTYCFAAAFGLAAFSIAFRSVVAGRRVDPVSLEEANGESPYESPRTAGLPPALPVGKVPVEIYRVVDLLGVGFVFAVFAGLILTSVQAAKDTVPVLNPAALLLNIGFQFFIAGIVAVFVVPRVGLVRWLGLRWPGWPWVLLIAPGAVFGMWMIFGGLQISGYVEWMESLGVETVQDTVKLLQESKDPLVLVLMAVAAVIAAPVCEEIVFRGYFYPVLKRFGGMWPAAICSALVFASAHGSLTALLPLFIFGGVLVFVYEKTGSIWAPMAVHCCFNGATVAVQILARYYDLPLEAAP